MIAKRMEIIETRMTTEEIQVLQQAEYILQQWFDTFGEDVTLTSVETGELVFSNEIPRVRGLLEALTENHTWFIK